MLEFAAPSGFAANMNQRIFPALALLAASLPVLADEAPEFSLVTAGGNHLRIVSELSPLAINRIHAWRLYLTDADREPISGASVNLSGGMPDHDHGLPTRPELTAEPEPGVYLIEGVRFHMPGRWLLDFSIVLDGATDSASLAFEL